MTERIYGLRVRIREVACGTSGNKHYEASLLGQSAVANTEEAAVTWLRRKLTASTDEAVVDAREQHAALTRVREVLERLKDEAKHFDAIAADKGESPSVRVAYVHAAADMRSVIEDIAAALEGSDS